MCKTNAVCLDRQKSILFLLLLEAVENPSECQGLPDVLVRCALQSG